MLVLKRLITFIATSVTLATAGMALAASGQPEPWQLGMQKGATPVMDDIIWFHDFLLWVISAIALFVLVLLITVMVKFNSRSIRSPPARRTTGRPGAYSGHHRGAVVPFAVLSAQCAEGGRDGESHRQAMVLELQLSGQQIRVRLASGL